jgi:hypothetical protein
MFIQDTETVRVPDLDHLSEVNITISSSTSSDREKTCEICLGVAESSSSTTGEVEPAETDQGDSVPI